MADQRKLSARCLVLLALCWFASAKLTDGFLYHQLQPVTSQSSNFSARYPDFLTNYHQNRQTSSASRIQRNDRQAARESASVLHQQAPDETCPASCHCNKEAQIVDCSNRNLAKVPAGFPKETKRIRLERNNISELAAYAFQGLKRLQRIDLSNNNLVKIDPLAFAGGLQSLNSLILYSNKLSQLPANLFSELSQLQLLLLNANSLQCINKELFQPLVNLSLLSLYDNNIETLANGTFDGVRNIKTIHLGKNPLVCDCNLRWLANYLRANPSVETSEAACQLPERNQGKKLKELTKHEFECKGNEQLRPNQCEDSSCPTGCVCNGSTVDCSRNSQSESRTSGEMYELPEIPDDVPVYVARMKINDNRIKRIRQTGLFRRLANSQKLDLGNNKIVDIEDNAIGSTGPSKPERVVFVLLENEHCRAKADAEDPCGAAPRVNAPDYDSPCYNGGSCKAGSGPTSLNYSCLCPPGFAGPLCEINIDDCLEHQCQNGAMCVDGVNSYRCVCRDPTTTGEFCEQLNAFSASSASNSIAPVALPMVAGAGQAINSEQPQQQQQQQAPQPIGQQILARSADFARTYDETSAEPCKRVTQRRYFDDGNGCQSVRLLKISECVGTCVPAKVKRRRIRMQCSDGASYVKTIDLTKKCVVGPKQEQTFSNSFNASHEDQVLQITRLDAVD